MPKKANIWLRFWPLFFYKLVVKMPRSTFFSLQLRTKPLLNVSGVYTEPRQALNYLFDYRLEHCYQLIFLFFHPFYEEEWHSVNFISYKIWDFISSRSNFGQIFFRREKFGQKTHIIFIQNYLKIFISGSLQYLNSKCRKNQFFLNVLLSQVLYTCILI